jgi:UDP-glucuronate 4-epimerase
MEILVTGGAGFIGSHVVDKLLERGENVICVDNFNDYYNPEYKRENIRLAKLNPNFKLYELDITNYLALKKVFMKHKIEKVIHLAARAGVRPSIELPSLYEDVNIKGTLNLLEFAKEFKIQNFVFASSSSVYGNANKVPFSEEDKVDYPISQYAATKKSGELFCYTYNHLYKIPMTCLRFFTVYGPRGRPDMAPYKFTKLINSGKQIEMYGNGLTKRDYTFVSDIVNGIMSALDKNLNFEIINLGNSSPITLKHFIEVIEKNLGKKAEIVQKPMQPGDVEITYADVSKAKKLLGYEPKIKFEEGMKIFVDWFLANRSKEQ